MWLQEEVAAPVEKLPREVVERLLWRPEDTRGRLEHSIQQYNMKVLQLVEVKLLLMYFSCLHLIEHNGACIIVTASSFAISESVAETYVFRSSICPSVHPSVKTCFA